VVDRIGPMPGLSPSQYGTMIHTEFAAEVRAAGLPGIEIVRLDPGRVDRRPPGLDAGSNKAVPGLPLPSPPPHAGEGRVGASPAISPGDAGPSQIRAGRYGCESDADQGAAAHRVPIPKFAGAGGGFLCELRNHKGTRCNYSLERGL
jgi:hypothetical protein